MKSKTALDPILAGALELEQLRVLPGRTDMQREAEILTGALERIGLKSQREPDPKAAGQLLNVAEALGALVISLVAYSRGRTPQVASQKPGTNIIVN